MAKARRRGEIDDRPALFLQMFGAGTDRREIALQIDREDDVEILLAHLGDAARADDAGIVDQIIEPAERLDGAVDDRLTARHRRDARGDRKSTRLNSSHSCAT